MTKTNMAASSTMGWQDGLAFNISPAKSGHMEILVVSNAVQAKCYNDSRNNEIDTVNRERERERERERMIER